MAGCLGLYCYTFVDFGPNHSIIDRFGQKPKQVHISHIIQKPISEMFEQDHSKSTKKQYYQTNKCRQDTGISNTQATNNSKQQITVVMYDWMKHPFSTGDIVEFSQVEGMEGINGRQYQLTVEQNSSFKIYDTISFPPYFNGGLATEVKVPLTMKFQSLKQTLNKISHFNPSVSNEDNQKSQQFHIILNALLEFYTNFRRLPKILDTKQADSLYQLLKQSHIYQNENNPSLKENLKEIVDYVSLYSQTQISPVCTFWGGIVAQQVLKITGMYTPLSQWLHFDLFDLIPKNINLNKKLDDKNRYNDYIALFGDQFIQKAKQSKGLIVGAGASACELVKIFSMMGFSSGTNGRIYVADDNQIRIHHLAFHFMFKKQNLNELKCEVVSRQARKFNDEIHLEPMKFIRENSEFIFNDDFWMQIDYVANTADREVARQFFDDQCVWYEKPHFATAHAGMQCYSESIIPHKTVSYTDSMTIYENGFELSTIKNFPFKTQHAIQWAEHIFYSNNFSALYNFLKDFNQDSLRHLKQVERQSYGLQKIIRNLNFLKELILARDGVAYIKCVEYAIDIFWDNFFDQIGFILERFPPDYIIEQNNTKFWCGLKRCPKLIALDTKNPLHLQFIQSGANILAAMLNIQIEKSLPKVAILTNQVLEKNPLSTRSWRKSQQQAKLAIQSLVNELKSSNFSQQIQLNYVSIDLDMQDNWQLQLFSTAFQLRVSFILFKALNYRLPLSDQFTVRTIIGKIKPKISTTAAISAGFQAMEIIKLFIDDPNLKPKNFHANFAVPSIIYSEPLPPKKQHDVEYNYIMMGPVKAVPPGNCKLDKRFYQMGQNRNKGANVDL